MISLKCVHKKLIYVTGVDDVSVTDIVWGNVFIRAEFLILHDVVFGCVAKTMGSTKGATCRAMYMNSLLSSSLVKLSVAFVIISCMMSQRRKETPGILNGTAERSCAT